jgi:signal peptide peptidase SppA
MIPLDLVDRPFALVPEVLRALAAAGATPAPGPFARPASLAAPPRLAVIPLHGVLTPRPSLGLWWFGGTALDQAGAALRAAVADPAVATIALWVDSSGGAVAGTPEFAAAVFEARRHKPVVAVVDGMMASAALWIGAQASEIIATPSADVGSLGVLALHADVSRALDQAGVTMTVIAEPAGKTEGTPFQPLSDPARAHLAGRVREAYQMFVRDVARGRGVEPATVAARYGQGRMLSAASALAAGLVDRIEWPAVLARLASVPAHPGRLAAATDLARRRARAFGVPLPAAAHDETDRRRRRLALLARA